MAFQQLFINIPSYKPYNKIILFQQKKKKRKNNLNLPKITVNHINKSMFWRDCQHDIIKCQSIERYNDCNYCLLIPPVLQNVPSVESLL